MYAYKYDKPSLKYAFGAAFHILYIAIQHAFLGVALSKYFVQSKSKSEILSAHLLEYYIRDVRPCIIFHMQNHTLQKNKYAKIMIR